jgi:Sap, sulfolipid-1-addressing protein
MSGVVGDILPLALGVAISPVPIIAVILMLFSARARSNGPAFLAGWVLGLALVGIVVLALAGPAGAEDDAEPSTVASAVKLLLGLLLLLLAVRQWRGRPEPGKEAELPGWMRAIDSFTAGRALGLGGLLSAVNPKNLALTIAAAATIAQAGLSGGGSATALAAFVVLGSASIAVPVVFYLLGGSGAKATLDGWKAWLGANNAAVMTVLLVVLGTVLLGRGIAGLFA